MDARPTIALANGEVQGSARCPLAIHGMWTRGPAAVAFAFAFALLPIGLVRAATFAVKSPDGRIVVQVTHDPRQGTLKYDVRSGGTVVITKGALGITTSAGDFTPGLAFLAEATGK